MTGLRPVVADEQLEVLRLLVDRRRCLGEEHTRKIAQLHRLLLELIPGGAKVFLSAAQARKLLASMRPRDVVGKTRKRVAMELVVDLEKIYARTKAADKELTELVKATGTTCWTYKASAPPASPAAGRGWRDHQVPRPWPLRVWNGTAPIDASSGHHVRHRLSRGGNRQINRVLHIMAVVQLRNPTEGRAYFDRKKTAGKTSMEAMRCLKRRLSDLVFKTMLDEFTAAHETDPGTQTGIITDSSAAGSQPTAGSSDKSLPGPATQQPRTPLPATS